jgi:polysaccharide biosynthesis PFTS motif protein
LGLEFDYYVPETAIAFLTDISTALGGASRPMCLKRKREVGRLAHVRYRHALDELDAAGAIVTIKPEVSAIRLIEACAAVISMPFTSTALLGRSLGKPSCYYDPTGMVIKDDKAAHGIPVISGRTELAAWLNSL